MDSMSAAVSLTCIAASTPVALAGVRAYRLYGGLREVTCPETMEAALVKIHATRAIASKLAGQNRLPLRSCSRWPEKKGCDEACAVQLRARPSRCRADSLPTLSRPAAGPAVSFSPGVRRAARVRG